MVFNVLEIIFGYYLLVYT